LLWPVCRLWLARSRSLLASSPGIVRLYRTTTMLTLGGTLLLIIGWHPTAPRWLVPTLPSGSARLSILPDRRSPPRLRPVVVLHCLRGCRQRLGATNLITGTAVIFRLNVGPPLQWFFYMRNQHPLPLGTVCGRRDLFFCFGEPAEGFGSLYLYASMNCFLTCLGYFIFGARQGGLFLWSWGV